MFLGYFVYASKPRRKLQYNASYRRQKFVMQDGGYDGMIRQLLEIIIFLTLGTYNPEGDKKNRKVNTKLGTIISLCSL